MKHIKLINVLKLYKNKRNKQYLFIIRRREMIKLGLTPKDILNTTILLKRRYQNEE